MNKFHRTSIFVLITNLLMLSGCNNKQSETDQPNNNEKAVMKKPTIHIILGSTRQGRTSDKIGTAIKNMADKRTDIITEIIDLKDYNLPFFNDEVAPASRETIGDPLIKKWSDTIKRADAFIIVTPEYNSGYPGVLKNALDSLYKEWNNKPVTFVGYSGGPSGGSSAIAQLQQVARALKMTPVSATITIPSAWKAFDQKGNLTAKNIEQELNTSIDQLINAKK